MNISKFKIFHFITILFVFVINTNNIYAQESIPFYRIGTGQGLSQSSVFCSFQDSKGYLWFGTAEGLNRYDGYNFKIFTHTLNDNNSLSSNDIVSIGEDVDGNIWAGTRTRGVSILNRATLKFDNSLSKNLNLTNTKIATIAKDASNSIWFSTGGSGLFKQDSKTKKITRINRKLVAFDNITAVFEDKGGNIWFGNSNLQIIKFESDQTFNIFNLVEKNASENSYISGIAQAKSGLIYATTNARGLFVLDETNGKAINKYYNNNVIDGENSMKSIVCTVENDLYIPTNDGLLIIPNEDLSKILHQKANSTKRFALSTHALTSILIDKNENVWIGSWEGGINVYYKKPPVFLLLRHEVAVANGPLERKITSVAADNNTIWLGTNIGLSEFNRKSKVWRHFYENQLSGLDITSLRYDSDGDLFIISYLKDLNVYFKETDQIKQFKIKDFKFNSSITVVAPNNNGKMWVGTRGEGVLLFDKEKGEFETVTNNFPKLSSSISISVILHDKKNRLWLGTPAHGLYLVDLNNNSFKKFSVGVSDKNISDEHILAIHQDKKNRIWIGTNGGGVNLFNEKEKTFTVFSVKEGLPNNTIKAILEDDKGNLWLSTNQGLCNFNYEKNTFKSYTDQDGLQGKEFGRGVAYKNKNGELFFGGNNGLTYFNPSDLLINPSQSPKIVFSDFKLFNKPVEIGGKDSPIEQDISLVNEITLKNSQNVFTIDFLALDFQQLKNYQYAYKLDGFDKDWNYVGTQRSASYTNMPEGTYFLNVKSTNNDGIWTENISKIKIKILPPWYRSIYAYIFYCLVLGFLLYVWRKIIKVRERLQLDIHIQKIEAKKIKELDIAKTNFFTNISHEFRTPLTLIISPLQQLMHNNNYEQADLASQHNTIFKNAKRLLRLINQILDISKIEAGNMKLEVSKNDIVEFLSSIAHSFKVLADKNNINYNIEINASHRYCFFDKDIIEKIAYNLLSNAFKFTPDKGRIDLKIGVKNQILTLEVIDNGIGMDAETTEHIFERYFQADGKKERKSIGTGIGLALTKELAELHLGSISVESQPNEGSRFIVEIPISANKFDITQIKENFDFHFENEPQFMQPSLQPNLEIALENDAPLLLIVEDNEELREYLIGIFESRYKIIDAENGEIGLELAVENMPDIILSDYMMPIMDGGEFCKAIKTDERTSHIPFVILTSRKSTETIGNSIDLGADDYIIKPFNVSLLLKKVESIIRSRSILKQKFGKVLDLIPENTLQNETEEKFFKKVIGIIEENLEDPNFDVSELENHLNLSKMQLYRKLKGVSNLAPNEFIRNIRLKKAAAIMKNTEMNISEIAYAVGFNDPAYFARCFRKEFGKAPTDFMNRKVS